MARSNISHKFTLTRHTSAVNALAISPQGSSLLSGGNDGHIVVWNLFSGEMVQEICVPSVGFISCLAWVKLTDRDEDAFVFGASDGNIHLYQRTNENPVFCFLSVALAHAGAVESLEWDTHHHRLASVGDGEVHIWTLAADQKSFVCLPSNAEKQAYIARSVHFLDDGSSVLVSYLESGYVFCYSIDPWDLKWKKKTNGRIGYTCLDGQHLLVSNLRDGIDKYAIPAFHRAQSYHHSILLNVPLQLSVAREAGLVIVGGDNGFARIFDLQTDFFHDKLDHGSAGDLIVAVAAFEGVRGCTIVTGSALKGHSNIKVWTQDHPVAGQPRAPTTESHPHASSMKQILSFAIVCVLINILMRYLPSSLPDPLFLSIPDLKSLTTLVPKLSFLDNASGNPVVPSGPVPAEKSVVEGTMALSEVGKSTSSCIIGGDIASCSI